MSNNISRIMIETVVKRYLRDIKDSPERSIRNLVDMALQFSNGRFQQRFFTAAQRMLKNENSGYYALVRDVATHVSQERLLRFGMNLGYNGCTLGARHIREKEAELHCNIPWSITLCLGDWTSQEKERVSQIVHQGESLGIHTWLLFAQGHMTQAIELASEHPDSAFVLFCEAEDLSAPVLDDLREQEHMMPALRFEEAAEEACGRLREAEMPYSVYLSYDDGSLESILNGEVLCSAQQLHPMFTALAPAPDCPQEIRRLVYQAIQRFRNEQLYHTIAWELVEDHLFVDHIISDDSCCAVFDAEGELAGSEGTNLFRQELVDIFRQTFPKKEAAE